MEFAMVKSSMRQGKPYERIVVAPIPLRHMETHITDTLLAPMIQKLIDRILNNTVREAQLNEIVRCFTYSADWPDVFDPALNDAITQFDSVCEQRFGRRLNTVSGRFRKGTVRGEDLCGMFHLAKTSK